MLPPLIRQLIFAAFACFHAACLLLPPLRHFRASCHHAEAYRCLSFDAAELRYFHGYAAPAATFIAIFRR
jgi:hypothetical protein